MIETFCSVQGEGPFAGRRAWFLRLAGCNFRCAGFGVEGFYGGRATLGCDTQRATYGAANARECTAEQLLGEMAVQTALWPHSATGAGGAEQGAGGGVGTLGGAKLLVVITGGEPLLQQNDAEFAALIRALRGCEIQFETNGTVSLSPAAQELLRGAHFAVGCKLASSGEKNRFNECAIKSLIDCGGEVFFKPVISAADCAEFFGEEFLRAAGIKPPAPRQNPLFLQNPVKPPAPSENPVFSRNSKPSQALPAIAEILEICRKFPAQRVFLMPQGATRAQLEANAPAVCAAAIALGFSYSDRLHIRLWDDKEGV